MPPLLKTALSIAVMLLCLALFFHDLRHGAGVEKWVVLCLGPLMVFGIWVFPEAPTKEIRREAAKRRSADAQ